MSGTFGGLSTALTALYAQRRGLEVAGQNIANANTDGYSRQRVTMQAVGGLETAAIFSIDDTAAGGVEITDVTRFRDEFLESRARTEKATNAYLAGQKSVYTRVEQVVGEPSDTGIQSQMAEYWSAWHDVTNRPGDAASRTQLLQRGTTLTDSIRAAYDGVSSIWSSTREQLDAYVTDVNTTATTVANLNEAVMRARDAGLPGNELADQRDEAVMKLASLTGGNAVLRDDFTVDFTVFGSSLVSGARTRELTVAGATRLQDQPGDPVGLRWTDNDSVAAVPSGGLASIIESLNTTLPGVANSMDAVAETLATTVNDQHMRGYDLDGNAGGAFFAGTTASTISVAFTDPSLVAASGSAPTPPATRTLDASNADAMADLAALTTGPDARYRQFVVDLGVAAQSTYRRAEIQNSIADDVEASRTAQSGVNLDEEMTSLLQYQRAYEAAAKVMTTIDRALESLINSI